MVESPGESQPLRQENEFGESAFFYEDQMVGYTYAACGFDGGQGFVPLPRPFQAYTLMDAGYRMLVQSSSK